MSKATNENGKVVIVTGGTFGIGKAITLKLAQSGYRVVSFGLDTPQPASLAGNSIQALKDELDGLHLIGEVLEADVAKPDDITRVVSTAIERFGRIDGVVNNAAIGPLGTILDTSEELWDRILSVNLKGPFLLCRAAIPHMIAQGGGSIVNIGSGAGWGKPNMAAYCASKGGIHALTSAIAYDHFRDRIRANTVIPGGGGIVTGMSLGRANGNVAKAASNGPGTAAGRHATPEDLANAVAFLISPEAEVISGTVLDVGCFAQQGGPIPGPK